MAEFSSRRRMAAGFLSRRRMILGGGLAAAAVPLAASSRSFAAAPAGLVSLGTPIRVFDSRDPAGVLGGDKLSTGQSVAITVSGAYLGDDLALAVFANITVTATEGRGYLVVRPEDLSGLQPWPSTSNVNWSSSGQTLANLTFSAVGGEHAIEVRCDGGGSTHVICDVQGYLPFVPT
jgi:hypothetical protein